MGRVGLTLKLRTDYLLTQALVIVRIKYGGVSVGFGGV